MYITILGRQPKLGIAEIESVFGGDKILELSDQAALIDTEILRINRFGGLLKAGVVIEKVDKTDWRKLSQKLVQEYFDKWSKQESRITLGISIYDMKVTPKDIQKTGVALKQRLKKANVSLRLVPNESPTLSTATSHHNKLGLSPNKVEILIVNSSEGIYIAESTGAQNITAYANRDQARPKRNPFVGMLPPKLAQIMINLAVGSESNPADKTLLDPFCGTGVILQETALMGLRAYGTDHSEKMIRYSRDNLNWLAEKNNKHFDWFLREADATKAKWRQPIDFVVSESYLGQPFSAPPSQDKLIEVRNNCNHIISEFLKNLASQIKPGTSMCLAVPAWRDKYGNITHLPLISQLGRLGYKPHKLVNVAQNDLIYYREDQIVARELLVLTKD